MKIALVSVLLVATVCVGRVESSEPAAQTLSERLQKLLDAQTAVRDATPKLDKADAAKVSAKQKAIIAEATALVAKLKGDGSAVAFTEVFESVLADMKRVQNRLAKADGGKATQALEDEIVGMLKEIIHALKTTH